MKLNLNSFVIFLVPLSIFLVIGNFLDALSNILEWFTLPISIVGSIASIVLFVGIKLLVKWRKLFVGEARLSRIRNLNLGFIGIFLTLWTPQFFAIYAETAVKGSEELVEQVSEIFNEDDKLKILLLPFSPDIDCQVRKTDYERQIIERYRQKSEDENLEIGIYFLNENSCPITKNDAKKLAKENAADLVIWGQYEDNCYEESRLRIRYSLSFDFYNAEQKPFAENFSQFQPNPLEDGDTEKQLLPNLDTLRKGYLLRDIDFLAYYFLALAELKEGRFSKSVELYRKSLELKPCDSGALAFLGHALLGSIRDSISYSGAISLFDYYLPLCEKSASLRYFKGNLYNEIGQMDSAIHYFEKVTALDDEFYYHLEAQVLLSEIYMKRQNFSMAEKVLEGVLEIESRWPYTYLYLGHLYRRKGEFEKAKEKYLEFGRKGHGISSAYELTLLSLQFEKIEETERYLHSWHNMVLESGHVPNDYLANIYYYYAWLSIYRKDLDGAKTHLEEAIKLDSSDNRYLSLYTSIETTFNSYDEVRMVYVRAN